MIGKNRIKHHTSMPVYCFMVTVIFGVTLHIHVHTVKAVLAVSRSIGYLLLLCVYCFHNIQILINLCLYVLTFQIIMYK